MDLAVAAAVFPVILLAELPDKTMFASLVMSTRAKPASVWAGAAAALALHVAIAVSVGVALLAALPHRALYWVMAATFVAGAALTASRMRGGSSHLGHDRLAHPPFRLLRRKCLGRRHPGRGSSAGLSPQSDTGTSSPRTARTPRTPRTPRAALLTAFTVIFVAEWGDLSQVLTADLAAHYRAPVSVAVGAVAALWMVAGVAVSGGRGLVRLVRAEIVRLATTTILTTMAGLSVWQALR